MNTGKLPEFDLITFDPTVMGARACIRGRRVTVALILNLVAGDSPRTLEYLRAQNYQATHLHEQGLDTLADSIRLDISSPASAGFSTDARDLTSRADSEDFFFRAGASMGE